jgi:hypothetical protein
MMRFVTSLRIRPSRRIEAAAETARESSWIGLSESPNTMETMPASRQMTTTPDAVKADLCMSGDMNSRVR